MKRYPARMRLLAVIALIVMLVSMIPLSAGAASNVKYVKTTNGLSANIRSSRKTHAENIIGHAPYGAKVTVLRTYSGWYYVRYGNIKGFISKSLLTSKDPGNYKSSRIRYVHTTDGNSLNIRSSCHHHTNNVVGTVPNGKAVTIYNTVGNWTRIKYGNVMGYVQSAYLRTSK